MKSEELYFSCVVDSKPLYQAQAYIWVTTLVNHINIAPSNIFVHLVGKEFKTTFIQWLEQVGVKIIHVTPFDTRSPYLNKLQQLSTFANLNQEAYVALMDCDTAVFSLENLKLDFPVNAKIVDFPVPSLDNLNQIYQAAGLEGVEPVETTFLLKEEKLTDRFNCNGGVVIISLDIVKELEKKWKEYAKWCVNNKEIFEPKRRHHLDQVSFAMALKSLKIELGLLDIEWNYPAHVNPKRLPDVQPKIIHYHKNLNQSMKLEKIGLEKVDSAIATINQVIDESFRNSFNNQIFWDYRYYKNPGLGSGLGSRGEVLNYKKRVLEKALSGFENSKILDVGCGDIETVRDFNFSNYTGVDVSDEAIAIAKSKKPNWNFKVGQLRQLDLEPFDVVICLDVLIHQQTEQEFLELIDCLLALCSDRLIIGAYNEQPSIESAITFYYHPIVSLLEDKGIFKGVSIIGTYRDVSLVVASKSDSLEKIESLSHKRDISSSELKEAIQLCKEPNLLNHLVALSRLKIGFFTKHFTRSLEYPWLASKLDNQVEKKYVLDVGAGLSPLPFFLANQGAKVFTVDYHPKIRTLKTFDDWNEWGFLDYSLIDERIKSLNTDALKFDSSQKFDYVYSISVIEHMPAVTRRKILRHLRKLMGSQGSLLLLTIDVVPNTDLLWNLSEGKQVDKEGTHGTVDSFCKELSNLGFSIKEKDIMRQIPHSRTDVLFVSAELNKNYAEILLDDPSFYLANLINSFPLKLIIKFAKKMKRNLRGFINE